MKDLFKISFLIILLFAVYVYRINIANFIIDNVVYRGNNKILTYNEYYIESNYSYLQNTDSKSAKSYQEVLNIIYTIINSGDNCFSFYCDYDNCINDVNSIKNNKYIVSNINNFVHPYNSFSSLKIHIGIGNRITIEVNKLYKESEIQFINNYINKFIDTNIKSSMNNYEKIKIFHDYIINNTKYDQNETYDVYTAYNLLTGNISKCSGYSDILAIYLNTLGIKNYKIASLDHIWNLVKVDDKWLHIDATWDDPIVSDGNQYLLHSFFLIDTKELLKLDTVEHNFDPNTYVEAK